MPTSLEIGIERAARQGGLRDCELLLCAATKDLFRKNAFRILGVRVDANTREIATQANKLMQLAEFGPSPHAQSAAFPVEPPPSLDEIREAVQKLKDPEKRLVDEFFWFWPEVFGDSQSDSAMQAIATGDSKTANEIWVSRENGAACSIAAKHNLALVNHVCALDRENNTVKNPVDVDRRESMADYWEGAFSRWEELTTNDQFWEHVVARIRQLNEPKLTTGFVRRMRATLPLALSKINAELALTFAESRKIELARLHIQLMRKANQGLPHVEKAAELVLTPARNRLKEQIQRAQERGKENPRDAAGAAKDLLQQAQPAASLFGLFFEEKSDFRNDLFDDVATVCNRLQVAYHDAIHDDATCFEILNSILPLATSIELRQQIEKNIAALKGFAADKKLEPVYALLKSIQDSKESPSARLARFKHDAVAAIVKAAGISGFSEKYSYLASAGAEFKELFDSAAIVLRGISLDAWNNHKDRETAVTANELASRHATSLELKQQLAEDKRTLEEIRFEANLAPISAAPSLSTINGIGCKLYGSSDTDSSTGSYLSTYYFVFLFIPLFPICRYRVTSNGTSYRFFGKAPLRTCDKWHLAIFTGIIISFIISLCSANGGASGSSSYTPPPRPAYNPPAPAFTPPAPDQFAQPDWAKTVTQQNDPSWIRDIKLSGTGGTSEHRVAIINNVTFGINERNSIYAGGHSVNVTCLEISDESVLIAIKGIPSHIKLSMNGNSPNTAPPPVTSAGNDNSDGKVYRVPSYVSSQLDREKLEIEADRTVLKQQDDQRDSLGRRIEIARIYLDKTSQNAIDTFNAEVDRYNLLSQQAKAANAAFNARVDSYNAKLQQYGR